MAKKFKMEGYIDYPGVGIIKDEDVYNLVIEHSRLVDRINPRKWVEMTLYGQCVLMGLMDDEIQKKGPNWKFYGKKNGIFK